MQFVRIIKRIWFRFIQGLINSFFAGTHFFKIKSALLKHLGLGIGENVRIVGPVYFDSEKVTIGDNCWIGRNFSVYGNGSVTIGSNCDFAPDIVFETGSHKPGTPQRRAGEGYCGDIAVGNGCWLGVRATVLSGVTIGNGSVIGAGSLVNKSIEENLLVGGVPCKEIKSL